MYTSESRNLDSEVKKKKTIFLKGIVRKETRKHSVQFSSVTQSCPTLFNPMNRSTPGLPVHHQLPEFTQTHVHRVGDAIQPSHPRSPPFPASNPSQHQSFPVSQLFTRGGQSIGVSALASSLPKNIQFSSVQSLSRVQLFATP